MKTSKRGERRSPAETALDRASWFRCNEISLGRDAHQLLAVRGALQLARPGASDHAPVRVSSIVEVRLHVVNTGAVAEPSRNTFW
jgi:hypothetical protein